MIRLLNKILLVILVFIAACKPDPIPEPIDEQPVFKVVGTLDGNPIDIAAGVDNYFMDSHFEIDALNVLDFKGTFKKTNCTFCTEELTISIRDRKTMEGDANFIRDLSLRTGHYPIEGREQILTSTTLQTHQFFSNNDNLAVTSDYEYIWVFNGVDTSRSQEPVFYFPEITDQTVQLTISTPDQNCTDSWQDVVKFFGSSPGCPSITTFSYDNPPSEPVYFTLPFFETDIISSNWSFGDNNSGQFGNATVISHFYDTPGIYEVCVDVVLQGGCSESFCSRVQSHRNVGCAAGYAYCYCVPQSYFFSNVSFDWISADGTVYSTFATSAEQPSDSFFEVTEIEPFNDDLDGEKTMKAVARVKAILFNVDDPSDKIILESNEIIFAVAYPDL